MSVANSAPPRIVIYGCGQYGGYFTRFALQKGWTIVAAFNRAGLKIGQDLGRIVGLDRDIGVIVQDLETGDYEALRGNADIGLVAQSNVLRVNMAAYQRLMNAGLNVGCHGSESYYPAGCDPEAAEEIDALAKANSVTFTGSAIWDMSRIWSGIYVTGPCTEITSLFHSSISDPQGQCTHKGQAAPMIGVGYTVKEFMAKGMDKNPVAHSYKTIPEHVLHALGYTIASVASHVEPIVFDEDVESWLMEGTVEAGLVVGSRVVVKVETEEGVTATAHIELRLFKPGEVEHMFWEVDGLPRTRVRVEREDSAHATAANLFNRVPQIIAAPPGIVLVSEMGPLRTTAMIGARTQK